MPMTAMVAEAAADPSSAEEFTSLFVMMAVAVAAPLGARASGGRVPAVVILLIGGMLVGPHMLGAAQTGAGVDLVAELGLGMLFLLAGFEIDPSRLRDRQGRSALVTWLLCLVGALIVMHLALGAEAVSTRIAVAIALTSTALGTLLPIIAARGLIGTDLGTAIVTHGAVGEIWPAIAIAVLLSDYSPISAVIVLGLFVLAAAFVYLVPKRLLTGSRSGVVVELSGGADRLSLRVALLILLALMALAAQFDLDVVLGAFAAGFVGRRLAGEAAENLQHQLEVVGYSLLIPLFFVKSGMGIDPTAITGAPLRWLIVVASIGLLRGLPVWARERWFDTGSGLTRPSQRVELALYAATGLPIIVAVTQVALQARVMSPQAASLLVAAGATTVLVFPALADITARRDRTAEARTRTDE